MKKLYYNKEESNFYWVTKRPKSLLIEWVVNKFPETWNHKGEVIEWCVLDQSVRWEKLTVSTCGKNRKHSLKHYQEDFIIIYPNQAGIPFVLEPATREDVENEIIGCKKWGVGDKYYVNLLKEIKI